MMLDQRITDAARHLADGVAVPQVDLDAVRSQARANRRQRAVMALTVVVAAIIVTGTALVMDRETSAPEPADPVGPAQLGGLPLTPYWHDGVLHVRGVEIETPWRRIPVIDVAGDTILAGESGYRGVDPSWAVVVGDRLEPVPVPFPDADADPRLSPDGRIVYWWSYPTADSTRVVTWDTETNRMLATRDLPGDDVGGGPRLYLAGIDADGMAYWVDEGSEIPVTRWDVRADTVEPMPDLRPSDVTFNDVRNVSRRFPEHVSPDGTMEVFDADDLGDPDSFGTFRPHRLGVRPVGSEDPSDVVRLRVPETDHGDMGSVRVWWETDETVLGVMGQQSGTDLMRCSIRDGACALVHELSGGEAGSFDWSFARFPMTG